MRKAGIEIIPKFEIKYPEYSLTTPQTLLDFTIRSLTVSEEETLKASLLQPSQLAQHLNKVIYASLVKKPENINDMETFLKNITLKDRDALMFALYHVTYKDIHNYDVTCPSCDTINSVKVNFNKSLVFNPWNKDKSILTNEEKVQLELASSVTIVLRQPTIYNEEMLLRQLGHSTEEIREKQMSLLGIKHILINIDEQKKPDIIEDRDNIQTIFNKLPASDKKLVDKKFSDTYDKYKSEVKTIVKCQKCGIEKETTIDLVSQFFRTMFE